MFDFLRNLRDEVVAEVSLMGYSCGGKSQPGDNSQNKLINIVGKDDGEYLTAIGYKYGSLYPSFMQTIEEKNLQHLDPAVIAEKLNESMLTPDMIRDVFEAYSVMNFLKEKEYSAKDAGCIMSIANIYDTNKDDKSISEIAILADCTEDSVSAVIKLLAEYRNRVCAKPFTMENATPNSGQTPVAPSPKQTTSKITKKTASASA